MKPNKHYIQSTFSNYNAIKMHVSTWGYYLLEKHFQKLGAWPTSKGLRGFGLITLSLINLIWKIYPFVQKLKDMKTNADMLIFNIEIFSLSLISCWVVLLALMERDRLFKLMIRFGDFKDFGVPKGLVLREKALKVGLKICDFVAFFISIIAFYETLLDKTCIKEIKSSNSYNLCLQYYIPFQVQLWQIALMGLFQVFTCTMIGRNCLYGFLFYSYTFELLTIRLEDLESKISEINFMLGEKNKDKLRYTMRYHQHISSLFNEATDFINKAVIPLKMVLLISNAALAVRISLGNYFSIVLFIATMTLLFLTHTIGQRVIDKSSSLFETIYDLNWYDAEISLQKDVFIFLCATQHPLIIKMTLFGSNSYPKMADETKKIYVWFNWINKFMLKKF